MGTSNKYTHEYKSFGQIELKERNTLEIYKAYEDSFVFTRTEYNHLSAIRGLRINLDKFILSSENRRILKKYPDSVMKKTKLPITLSNYNWKIHKIGSDFYKNKFGEGVFSANKIKELIVTKHNFNFLIKFHATSNKTDDSNFDGFVIIYQNKKYKFCHYCYPFHSTEYINSNFGIYMMTRTINYYKQKGYKYIYLGSMHSSASKYKLQFTGAEWWDETQKMWSSDIKALKDLLNNMVDN